jgi:VWFA-related protein
MRRLSSLCLLALLALLAGPVEPLAAADTPPPPPPPPAAAEEGAFIDIVNVDVVNVDVYVTDRAGNAITGLTREDFELFEDKRPVAITNFYAEEERAPVGPGTATPAPPEIPGVPRAEPVPDDQRLYFVVFIDNFNIRPFNRNRVFRRLRSFLDENVSASDRVMLLSYNRSLKTRVPFTSDPRTVTSATFEMETETGFGVHRDSERRDLLNEIERAEQIQEVMGRVRAYAGSYYNDTMVTIDALKEVVSSLGGLPGRKAFLYVSDGIPMVVGEDMFQLLNEKFRESSVLMQAREFDAGRRFQELASSANANRVTFYTIDAGGLRTLTSASAEQQTAGSSMFIDTTNNYNLQAPLIMLAEQTGGRAIYNTNDIGEQLSRVSRDLRTFYSLGYQPAHAGDGRYHRLEVKVKRKGLRVRHRAGYRDKGLEQRMSDGTMAALLFSEMSNPLGLGLDFGSMTAREDGHMLVPVHLRIPLDKVTMIPQGEHQEARLRVFIAAVDEDGSLSPVQSTPLPIRIPLADLARARELGWGYDVTLLMRRGHHRVAVGLRDEIGAVSSYVTGGVLVR